MAFNPGANYGGNFSGIPVVNPTAPGGVYTMGLDLPHVNPNTYSGNVHFGPASTYTGQAPPRRAISKCKLLSRNIG